jgi:hypothetical protein
MHRVMTRSGARGPTGRGWRSTAVPAAPPLFALPNVLVAAAARPTPLGIDGALWRCVCVCRACVCLCVCGCVRVSCVSARPVHITLQCGRSLASCNQSSPPPECEVACLAIRRGELHSEDPPLASLVCSTPRGLNVDCAARSARRDCASPLQCAALATGAGSGGGGSALHRGGVVNNAEDPRRGSGLAGPPLCRSSGLGQTTINPTRHGAAAGPQLVGGSAQGGMRAARIGPRRQERGAATR